jgi:hypothetical protein
VHHYEQFLSIFFLEILMKLMIKIVEVDKWYFTTHTCIWTSPLVMYDQQNLL